MGYGPDKAWKVFYYPSEKVKRPGEFGTRVAMISASDKNEASYKFQKQYEGEFHTISKIEEA